MRLLMLTAILVAGMTTAYAQEDDEEREFIVEQFKGWSGVMLRCVPNSSNKILTERFCDTAAAEFSYLAENSSIPNVVSRGENTFQMYMTASKIGKPLILELEAVTTTGQTGPIGVHVRLSANRFYSQAVDLTETAGGPRLAPRGGTLTFWEDSLIAAGMNDQDLARVVAPYVGEKVKLFFAQFLKGWNAK
jgi:hypothetical protein